MAASVVVVLAVVLSACNASGGLDPALLTSDATIVAQDLALQPTQLRVPAGRPLTLALDNRDAGIPHGLVVTRDDVQVAAAEIITGPGKVSLTIPPLAAGTYAYACPVHPNMLGALLVGP